MCYARVVIALSKILCPKNVSYSLFVFWALPFLIIQNFWQWRSQWRQWWCLCEASSSVSSPPKSPPRHLPEFPVSALDCQTILCVTVSFSPPVILAPNTRSLSLSWISFSIYNYQFTANQTQPYLLFSETFFFFFSNFSNLWPCELWRFSLQKCLLTFSHFNYRFKQRMVTCWPFIACLLVLGI